MEHHNKDHNAQHLLSCWVLSPMTDEYNVCFSLHILTNSLLLANGNGVEGVYHRFYHPIGKCLGTTSPGPLSQWSHNNHMVHLYVMHALSNKYFSILFYTKIGPKEAKLWSKSCKVIAWQDHHSPLTQRSQRGIIGRVWEGGQQLSYSIYLAIYLFFLTMTFIKNLLIIYFIHCIMYTVQRIWPPKWWIFLSLTGHSMSVHQQWHPPTQIIFP